MTPHEQHQHNLERLQYHERMAEYYRTLTREYMYAIEAQRVQDKKKDSEEYYKQLKNK